MPVAKKSVAVELAPIKIQPLYIEIAGTNPLITHAFSSKTEREILEKHMAGVSAKKKQHDAKVPIIDAIGGLHLMPPCDGWHGTPEGIIVRESGTGTIIEPGEFPQYTGGVYFEGRFGFPTVGIKAAAVSAAKLAGIAMTDARQAFHIPGTLFEIETESGPVMRMDPVRVNNTAPDIRFRPEFQNWKATIRVDFDISILSTGNLLALFRRAGFAIGLGEWRPQKNGPYGTFEVTGSSLGEVQYI